LLLVAIQLWISRIDISTITIEF